MKPKGVPRPQYVFGHENWDEKPTNMWLMNAGNIKSPLNDTRLPLSLNTILLDTILTFLKDLWSFCLRTCYYQEKTIYCNWEACTTIEEKRKCIFCKLAIIKLNWFFRPLQWYQRALQRILTQECLFPENWKIENGNQCQKLNFHISTLTFHKFNWYKINISRCNVRSYICQRSIPPETQKVQRHLPWKLC